MSGAIGSFGFASWAQNAGSPTVTAAPAKKAVRHKPRPVSTKVSPTPTPTVIPAPTPAPSASAVPISPWIQPLIGIAQITVTALLAFVLWRLTFIFFVRNAEQKINERQGAWFHKVVVDPQLSSLNTFVEHANVLLLDSARSCEAAKQAGDAPELERRVELTISSFNELLLPAQRGLSDMVNCFDHQLADECTDRFGTLQDEVTTWFESLLSQQEIDRTISLPGAVSIFRSDIISRLRQYEFETYGFERPSLIRSLLGW